MLSLGYCYHGGDGVPRIAEKEAYWYKRAAESGNAEAQYLYALCLEAGELVPQDFVQAIKWYEKAAAQGNGEAKEALAKRKIYKILK
nr:tetratricopeptide repeat protein [Candidatus Borkfalkia ceftriaxoniphila]